MQRRRSPSCWRGRRRSRSSSPAAVRCGSTASRSIRSRRWPCPDPKHLARLRALSHLRVGRPLHRARHGRAARLRRHERECAGRGRDLRAPRRPAARDRARRGAGPGPHPAGDHGAPRRPAEAPLGRRSRPPRAPADAARARSPGATTSSTRPISASSRASRSSPAAPGSTRSRRWSSEPMTPRTRSTRSPRSSTRASSARRASPTESRASACSSTIREYAMEKLGERGEAEMLRRTPRRVGGCRSRRRALPGVFGEEQRVVLDRYEMEHDNIRAALAWARRSGQHARPPCVSWHPRGASGRCAASWPRPARLRNASWRCRASEGAPDARAAALEAAGGIAYWQADYGRRAAVVRRGTGPGARIRRPGADRQRGLQHGIHLLASAR